MTELEFLQATRQEVKALADRIERDADVYLPRGFALGRANEAAALLRRASRELRLAINERLS